MNERKSSEDFHRCLASFRKFPPGATTKIASDCGLNTRTVRRYYDDGNPRLGMEPIRIILEREQLLARAELEKQRRNDANEKAKETRELSQKHAVEARAEEGRIVDFTRAGASRAAGIGVHLAIGAMRLSELIEQELKNLADTGHVDPFKGVKLLKDVADTMDKINSLAFKAMEMERLHLGEPTHVIEVQSRQELTLDDVKLRLAAAQRAVDRVESRGSIHLLPSGTDRPLIGTRVTKAS